MHGRALSAATPTRRMPQGASVSSQVRGSRLHCTLWTASHSWITKITDYCWIVRVLCQCMLTSHAWAKSQAWGMNPRGTGTVYGCLFMFGHFEGGSRFPSNLTVDSSAAFLNMLSSMLFGHCKIHPSTSVLPSGDKKIADKVFRVCHLVLCLWVTRGMMAEGGIASC